MAKLKSDDGEVELADGEPIREAAEQLGVPFGCRNGLCGSCLVEIDEGKENLSEKTEAEEDFGLEDHQRLCCQAKIKEGEVKITF
jgi:ferredoxin